MDIKDILDDQAYHIGQVQEAFKRVFGTEDGQLVLKHITKKCLDGMGTKGDTNDALINIGKQSVFLWLMEILELNKEMYLQLFMKEEFGEWNRATRN
ncbi:MAG: hypothetical protein IJT36_09230 [Alphaproteobacteria bacterium]|nr:hypothetical protein [Alphaproteobacteria bacterium]